MRCKLLLFIYISSLIVFSSASPVLAGPISQSAESRHATIELTPEVILWIPQIPYAHIDLRVMGPNGRQITKEFALGVTPQLTIQQGEAERLRDGRYVYELSLFTVEKRADGLSLNPVVNSATGGSLGGEVVVQSGDFRVVGGKFEQLPTTIEGNGSYRESSASAEGELQAAAAIVIDFEQLVNYEDVSNQYSSLGVTFSGAVVLGQGQSLNSLNFPPKSGTKVIYDNQYFNDPGTITMAFDDNIVHGVSKVGAYVTGNRDVTMTAYDSNGDILGSQNTGGSNIDDVGDPNTLLQIGSSAPIAYVKFTNGGERGNTYTIDDFFFESGQLCQVTGVPLYKQGGSSEWANDPYGGSVSSPWKLDDDGDGAFDEGGKDTPETISKWGCAMTSAAMIVSYHGLGQNGFTTTPRLLNNWLREHGGYSGGSILWPKVAEYAREVGNMSLYYYAGREPNHGIVNGYLCNLSPMILETRSSPYGQHFFVATGQIDEDTWTINDPGGYNLNERNTDQYVGFRKYSTTAREPQWLSVAVHSPITLLITDPAGRRTGYDPVTGEFLNEILDAIYQIEMLAAQDDSGSVIETLVFETGSPLSGQYSVQVNGTGAGSYMIDLVGTESDGEQKRKRISGAVAEGTAFNLMLNYDASSSTPFEVTSPENLAPMVSAGGPYSGVEGSEVVLDASLSVDPEGQPLVYRWDVDDDGVWDVDWTGDSQVAYVFTVPGEHTLRVEAADGLSMTSSVAVASIEALIGPPASIEMDVSALEMQANGSSVAVVSATVKDESGTPIPNQSVEFSTSLGEIDNEAVTDEDGVVSATLTAGVVIGTAEITAFAGEAAGTIDVEFVAGPPVTLAIAADPTTLLADGNSTSSVVVVVRDGSGNPVAGQTVTFATTRGSISSSAIADLGGIVTATLSSVTTAGAVTVTASAGDVDNSTQIEFVAGPPASVDLTASPSTIQIVDGVRVAGLSGPEAFSSTITVVVNDAHGNPVPDASVAFTATGGTIESSAKTDNFGTAQVTFEPDLSPGVARLTATAGAVEGVIEIVIHNLRRKKMFMPMLGAK